MGLRFTISRAHGVTPYRLLFGKEPLLPSSVRVREFDVEAALEAADVVDASGHVEALAAYLWDLHQVVAERLALYDTRSKKYYDSVRKEQETYEFSKGQAVILKQRKTGGIRLPAQGPYRFVKYNTKSKLTATIENPDTGKRDECSTAHLLPYYGKLGEVTIDDSEVIGARRRKKRRLH